jgi:EAL domain-containing protein (putative c-di-GMP-specific phosphodiesterase class I)/GGDEF domain-containing protein
MFKYSEEFTNKLQQQLDSCIANNSQALLLLIEIINLTKLKITYSSNFSNQTSHLIVEGLKELLGEEHYIETIDSEYIAVIINESDNDIFDNLINKIQNYIQLFESPDNNSPIHVNSTISSVLLNHEIKTINEAIEYVYLTSKNSKFDENKFYHTYQELTESKQNYRNQFILANCLKHALISNKLRLAYQPIINSKNGVISHYECLLRIVNSEDKIVSAGPFIPVAEELGFINLIDEIVLEMVIEELKNAPTLTLTFNLSTLGVYNHNWLSKLQKLVTSEDLSSRLIVEITETAAHQDLSKAAYFVATLQEMGCQVALDDFGSGNTSFRQLKALPVDLIKIDGSFIRDIAKNSESQLFVKTLITMSKAIGLKSVAEFVENGEIAKILIGYEVDFMQGNYFCPAVNYRSWGNELI